MTGIKLSRISFRHPRGSRVFNDLVLAIDAFPAVILGPNGAGKTTLFGIISGRLRPNRGELTLHGMSSKSKGSVLVASSEQRERPIRGLRAVEQVAYAGWLQGMRSSDARKAANVAIERVGLSAEARKPAVALSGGQLQRLGLAEALVAAPTYLLLDEPYAGLDPEQRQGLREVLSELAQDTGLVVSTHQTEDVEGLYASVIVLARGAVLYSGRVEDFVDRYAEAASPPHLRVEQAYLSLVRQGDEGDQ